jgi:hypothetical protein
MVICDKRSFRNIDPLVELPLFPEELLKKKEELDKKRKERNEMEFIEGYMR